MKFPLQLSCFCLMTLFGEILGQDVVRVVVEEDSDAILPCSPSTKEDLRSKLFDWKKDDQKEVFLYDKRDAYNNGRPGQDEQFKGRVSHFEDELEHGDASIKIINTTLSDSGNYSCIFPRLQPRQTFYIELVVEPIVKDRSGDIKGAGKPSVTALETKGWALLLCVVQSASPKPKVEWWDSAGNIVHAEEPQVTERGGSYDIILKANVTKTDNYSCVVTQEEIYHQTEADIYVHPGAASKPFVTTLKTKDGVMLQCEVQGASPKPKVEWRDSAGNIVHAEELVTERGGSYDIILEAKVTKTDNYRCVVTQEEIKHQTEAEIYVHTDYTGWIITAVFLSVLVVVCGGLIFLSVKGFIKCYSIRKWLYQQKLKKLKKDIERVLEEGLEPKEAEAARTFMGRLDEMILIGPKEGTQRYKGSLNEGQPGGSFHLIASSP